MWPNAAGVKSQVTRLRPCLLTGIAGVRVSNEGFGGWGARVGDVIVVHHFGGHPGEGVRPLQKLKEALLKLLRKACAPQQ